MASGEKKWVETNLRAGAYNEAVPGSALKWSLQCSPASIREKFAFEPGFTELVDRELETIGLNPADLPLPKSQESTINVSQELQRQRYHIGFINTLTPGAKPFLLHRLRIMHGIEFLRSQSLYLADEAELASEFKNAELQDLGGNAFSARVCGAVLKGTMVPEN